ncbi:facilitated trehalose transporter Tret1 isoform X1 [Glossina fuscipes]|uniref:Facilitated trehalose transporter Tret1 isoform X1 n=1 Tax=Glossina fuscipes TaxID=7396 RepID=A0A9C5YVQ1_9MUSC|nr:facilitated trehalose transporter Tret1 isoform X1 [Glossina fuscipes]XP_037887398.1 facilitated trehalose transporter Tret1 isoform X1 [Glossina fuscipes]
MNGRENRAYGHNLISSSSATKNLKDELSREDQSYQNSLTSSTAANTFDKSLPEDPFFLPPSSNSSSQFLAPPKRQRSPGIFEREFPLNYGLIIQADDINEPPLPVNKSRITSHEKPTPLPLPPPQHFIQRNANSIPSDDLQRSHQSLRGSRISFEKKVDDESSDEDTFEKRRLGYQKQKALSVDQKGILRDLKTILANDNRRQYQAKKHVSLDVKGTGYLRDLLKDSSSEEEFHKTRCEFQGRKHQSLDSRVTFNLEKVLQGSSTDTDDEVDDAEHKRLLHRPKDITKPVIIDLKNLVPSDESEEDYSLNRQNFQQQRSISNDSRKSYRVYEMDEAGHMKGENLRNTVPFVRQITEDGKPKLEVYRPTTNPIFIWTQVLAAFSVSLGSLVVGFSSAYTSPALVSMTDGNVTSFLVTEQSGSWVGGIMPLAGLAGGIAGGPLIEYLGRRNTILATAVPFIISWLLIACAVNIVMVLAGRALAGFCVGIASLALPVYLGETIQPEVRGTLGLLPTAFGNVGILLCFTAGTYMNWSMLAFLGAVLPVPFLILMFLIPETPRWYVSRKMEDNARKALVWLRGKQADVDPELKGLVRSQVDDDRQATTNQISELFKRNNLKPLSISLGLMFFQQFSGINAVIFYTVSIFKDAGSTIDNNLCTIIVGLVNFIATFMATVLIDRLGRKVLLYISDVAMIMTLFTLGGFFYCKESGMNITQIGWLPLASFVIYVVGFSLGFGPIPWLMMGEILPAKIRGTAASVATAFNWTCTFIVTKTYQDMIDSIGAHGAFWLFGVVCFIGLFFVIFYVPETQGKSLEDIERKMMGRVRRMSSLANIKPLSFNM